MDEEQFKAAMEMTNPTIESIEEIAVMKKQKSEEENKSAHEKNQRAEEEERLRREELSKRMANGEPITDELLFDIFSKRVSPEENRQSESDKNESKTDSGDEENK